MGFESSPTGPRLLHDGETNVDRCYRKVLSRGVVPRSLPPLAEVLQDGYAVRSGN